LILYHLEEEKKMQKLFIPVQATSRKKRYRALKIILSLFFVLLVLGSVTFFLLIVHVKDTEEYQLSLRQVRHNPQVIEALGMPLEPGFFVMHWSEKPLFKTQFEEEDSIKKIDLNYSVRGPKGEGQVFFKADKVWKVGWKIDELKVVLKANQRAILVIPSP